MVKRGRTLPNPQPGWALYLRTSDKEVQNPANSQSRQRNAIRRALLGDSDLPLIDEYIDNQTGRASERREGYQHLLRDARAGRFSHVAVENAERFGRNDAEALSAIDELDAFAVAVRFADYPDLDPMDPDDRILVSLSFTLARRESMKTAQRVRGGMFTKLERGGHIGRAPDGYLNLERRISNSEKLDYGRYDRWIAPDPERREIWRFAWDLLLTDRYTLEEICEELHARGHRLRSGRPFVQIGAKGNRTYAANTLSKIFHNWTYAGWVVSEEANIPPKTIRGNWEPLIGTDEFEQGLVILQKRNDHPNPQYKHVYLLTGLLYLQKPGDSRLVRLTGSTPNAGRKNGGTSYYCVKSSDINLLCQPIDAYIATAIQSIQVHPDLIPVIRQHYTEEIASQIKQAVPAHRQDLDAALKAIDEEEARALRLFVAGKITESVWDGLWREWQDRRLTLRENLDAAERDSAYHIDNLDAALHIISKMGVLYHQLERQQQKKLLREVIDRIVVDAEGNVLRIDLLPPFAYLHDLACRTQSAAGCEAQKTKTSPVTGSRSTDVFSGGPWFRTPDGTIDRELVNLLQEAFGYSLTADIAYQIAFWLYGEAASGKSTAIKVLKELMGNAYIEIDLSALNRNQYQLAEIQGKRVVSCTEAAANSVLQDNVFKQLVSGEEIVTRQIRQSTRRFKPQAKIWWAMNEMPRNQDRSSAVYRRLAIIPFRNPVPFEKRDRRLDEKLKAEAPGIFRWALEGLRRLRRQGHFTNPASVREALDGYKAENDIEAAFVADWTINDPEHKTKSGTLYQAYKLWCELFGYCPQPIRTVSGDWIRLGYPKLERGDGNYYVGIALTAEATKALQKFDRTF
jgi:P4 family phage/plasmid primase-like protien